MSDVPRVFVVVGLGYGDEGKGTVVDHLARKERAAAVVRYNGGPQAAHHVVEPGGRWHCFSQFGAGTLVPGVRTHLSRQMRVKLPNLLAEARALATQGVADPLRLLSLDPSCGVVMSSHAMLGQMREVARGAGRLGSVGMGVGEAVRDSLDKGGDALVVADFFDEATLRRKIEVLCQEKRRAAEDLLASHPSEELRALRRHFACAVDPVHVLRECLELGQVLRGAVQEDGGALRSLGHGQETVIFEGAHGTLLDPCLGFAPYVTKSPSTAMAADALLSDVGATAGVIRVGVVRAYASRHGAGPFVTEDGVLTARLPEVHNAANPWQGPMRVGWFDRLATRYALEVNPRLDSVALTCLDRLSGLDLLRVCVSYEYVGDHVERLDSWFEWDRRHDGRIRVTSLKACGSPVISGCPADAMPPGELASLLADCRPLDFVELPGWRDPLGEASRFADLPRPARDYVDFLESQDGLDNPVSLVSVGPTWRNKLPHP